MNDHLARAAMAEQHRGHLLAEAQQSRTARLARRSDRPAGQPSPLVSWTRKVRSSWRSRSGSASADTTTTPAG